MILSLLLFAGRKLTPLWGITPPPGDKAPYHGHGMVPLIKYVADQYGRSQIADLYHAVRLPVTTNAVDLLFSNLSTPEYVWWPEFVKRYLSGEIYNVPADTFSAGPSRVGPAPREFDHQREERHAPVLSPLSIETFRRSSTG